MLTNKMSVSEFKESLKKFDKEKIIELLQIYQINDFQNELGCIR